MSAKCNYNMQFGYIIITAYMWCTVCNHPILRPFFFMHLKIFSCITGLMNIGKLRQMTTLMQNYQCECEWIMKFDIILLQWSLFINDNFASCNDQLPLCLLLFKLIFTHISFQLLNVMSVSFKCWQTRRS